MKNKSQFYSNFKYNPINNSDTFNNLIIDDLFNLSTKTGSIKSNALYSNLLECFFSKETADEIKANNPQILKQVLKIIPYEYFNESDFLFKTRVFALSDDNTLFELNLESKIFVQTYVFENNPNIIFSNNTLYFFDKNNKYVLIEDNNLVTVENLPCIKSFASDSTNLFFTTENFPNKIFQSEYCDLKTLSNNLEQYSTISTSLEDGDIENIFCLKDKLYIFTQYAILKFDSKTKTIQKQNNLNLFIYKNSIKQVDDNILFYTSDGLYLFDGIDVRQIFNNQLNISKNADFIYFNHKLYIFDALYENIIFKYNLSSNSFSKLKIDNLINLYIIKTRSCYSLAFCHKDDNLNTISIFNDNQNNANTFNQYLVFKPTFLNTNTLKQINKIFVKSIGSFQIKITSELSSSSIDISKTNQIPTLSLNGTFFVVEIYSNSYFELDSILINYTEVGE